MPASVTSRHPPTTIGGDKSIFWKVSESVGKERKEALTKELPIKEEPLGEVLEREVPTAEQPVQEMAPEESAVEDTPMKAKEQKWMSKRAKDRENRMSNAKEIQMCLTC